jgi:hypothetical protein
MKWLFPPGQICSSLDTVPTLSDYHGEFLTAGVCHDKKGKP